MLCYFRSQQVTVDAVASQNYILHCETDILCLCPRLACSHVDTMHFVESVGLCFPRWNYFFCDSNFINILRWYSEWHQYIINIDWTLPRLLTLCSAVVKVIKPKNRRYCWHSIYKRQQRLSFEGVLMVVSLAVVYLMSCRLWTACISNTHLHSGWQLHAL